jgi:hypothetical protein
MMGYLRNAAKTREVLDEEGWLVAPVLTVRLSTCPIYNSATLPYIANYDYNCSVILNATCKQLVAELLTIWFANKLVAEHFTFFSRLFEAL